MMNKKTIGVRSLTREAGAITAEFKIGNFAYTISDIHENIIRCALGEEDMAYLLGEEPNPKWKPECEFEYEFIVPARDEGRCFGITTKEFRDMMRQGNVRCDITGRADAVFVG